MKKLTKLALAVNLRRYGDPEKIAAANCCFFCQWNDQLINRTGAACGMRNHRLSEPARNESE